MENILELKAVNKNGFHFTNNKLILKKIAGMIPHNPNLNIRWIILHGSDAFNKIRLDACLKYYTKIYGNFFGFPLWKFEDGRKEKKDLPLMPLLYAWDRNVSHVTSADKILRKAKPSKLKKNFS